MFGKTVRVVAVGALILSNVLALAQGQTVGSAATDTKLATVIKPADLPEGYKAVRLKLSAAGGVDDMFSGPMGLLMGVGNHESGAVMKAMALLDVSWTKGDVVSLSGHDFLIVYKPDFDLAALSQAAEQQSKGPNLELRLNYVRIDLIASIAPRPDITKADLVRSAGGVTTATPEAASTTTAPASATSGAGQDAKAATMSNAKQAALGMLMYGQDYDDYLPYVQDTRSAYYVTYPYVKNVNVFKTLNPKGGILKLNMSISGLNMTAIPAPAETPLYYDTNAWPDGTRVVAFVDGHVKSVAPDEWAKLQANLNLKVKRTIKPLPPNYGADFGKKPGGGG